MHELKEFVDHRFEKLPMGSEKAWILANNIHDVGGDDSLVVLSSLLLTQTQQVLRKNRWKTSAREMKIVVTIHTRNNRWIIIWMLVKKTLRNSKS